MELYEQFDMVADDSTPSEAPVSRRGLLGWVAAAAIASGLTLTGSAEARNRHDRRGGRKNGRGNGRGKGRGNGRGHHRRGSGRN